MALRIKAKSKSKPKAANRRRKGALAVLLPWLKRFGLWLSAIIIVFWLGGWLVLTGTLSRGVDWTKMQIIRATADSGFTVQDLLVEGRENADPVFLRALMNVQAGDPLFGFDPNAARILLEDTEWVRRAHVERRLPGTIYIRLEERKPTALWQKDGALFLVDEDGKEIKTDRISDFSNLIITRGNGAPENIFALRQLLVGVPAIEARAKIAERIGNRRWDLTLENGLVLKLPEEDIGYALERAADAQETDGLLEMEGLQSIDLRHADKIIIRTKPGNVREYKRNLQQQGGAVL
jgi:cell division protein FtsQ